MGCSVSVGFCGLVLGVCLLFWLFDGLAIILLLHTRAMKTKKS